MKHLRWKVVEEHFDSIYKRWQATHYNEIFRICYSLSGYSVFWVNRNRALIYCLDTIDDAKRFVDYVIENESIE